MGEEVHPSHETKGKNMSAPNVPTDKTHLTILILLKQENMIDLSNTFNLKGYCILTNTISASKEMIELLCLSRMSYKYLLRLFGFQCQSVPALLSLICLHKLLKWGVEVSHYPCLAQCVI